jgi:hypothetical protein
LKAAVLVVRSGTAQPDLMAYLIPVRGHRVSFDGLQFFDMQQRRFSAVQKSRLSFKIIDIEKTANILCVSHEQK